MTQTDLEQLSVTTLDTVGNQIVVSNSKYSAFYSYNTIIASKGKQTNIFPSFNYSVTTSKYLSEYLNQSSLQIRNNLRDSIFNYKGKL